MQDTVVVVPCYNEASRLEPGAFLRALAEQPTLRFVLVDDGSRDGTRQMLEELVRLEPTRISMLALDRNSGKAEAVRRGVLHAFELEPKLLGYWDADLATPLDLVPTFAAKFEEKQDLLVVLGSRVRLLGGHISRTPARHYVGRVFATVAALTLGLAVYDTQCGAKLFRATGLIRGLFERPFRLNWLFDVELLARLLGLEARGLCSIQNQCIELPLDCWVDTPGSKLVLGQFPKIISELVQLRAIVELERRKSRPTA